MLTIFTTPKPFKGHLAIIQHNAIKSWTLLHPDVEIILFGDEEGAADIANELGICHESKVLKNEHGTKYLGYIFDRAQEIARHDSLCYVNCDIILMSDFIHAVEQVMNRWQNKFLMVGQRWDMDIDQLLDFKISDWERQLSGLISRIGKQRPSCWIDYFAFRRGTYREIPPLVIGRVAWDNWLIWKARSMRVPVVDATLVVKAVHQNHDYSYHPEGAKGVWEGQEARRNRELAGGWSHLYSIDNATHILTKDRIKWALERRHARARLICAKNQLLDYIKKK
jgi:hypothetical protein